MIWPGSIREQVFAGVMPCSDGAYRLVAVSMNGESLKGVKFSAVLEGGGPGPGLKPGTPVVLALPRREVIVKTVRVPSRDERQIAQMVPYEAAAQLPWPPEESQVGFEIQDSDEPEYSDLVLFMCRKETVQNHLAALKKWNISPSRVEAGFLSAGRLAWMAREESPAFLIVDVNGIEYARYRCGRAVFTRGTSGDEDAGEVLARSVEIDRRLNGSHRCDAVYVAGDAAPDAGVLAEKVKLDAPFRPVSALLDAPVLESSDAVCAGAALGGADYAGGGNLLPEREMRLVVLRHIFRQGRRLLVAAIWLIGVLAGLGYFFFSREAARAARAEEWIASIRGEVGDLKEQYEALELLAGERSRVGLPLDVVLELYRVTPQTVSINSFTYDSRRTVAFGGEAPSFRAAWAYMDALLRSKLFSDVEMRHAATPQPGKAELVEFKVTCGIVEAK